MAEGEEFSLVYSFSDTDGMRLYVDGVEVGTNADAVAAGDSLAIAQNNEFWTLGASQIKGVDDSADTLEQFLQGSVGHFEIYSDVRTPSELNSLHDLSDGSDDGQTFGTAGDDTIHSGASVDQSDGGGVINDQIRAGDGDDTVFAGDGNDRLDGGGGNDTIYGGIGDDTITTGTGDDLVVLSASGGQDTIPDFDIADADGDGLSNDQLDVTELRTLDGGPVKINDVIVSDDGSGNAVLTFPEGESALLQGITPEQMTKQQMAASGVPCLEDNTRILTAKGEEPAAALKTGDLVVTRDHGIQPILWIADQVLNRETLDAQPEKRPVRLATRWTGAASDFILSPQHGVVVRTKNGTGEVLARAAQLGRLPGGQVRVAHGIKSVRYVHILLPEHGLVWVNGVLTESLYPGPEVLKSLSPENLLSLLGRFPRSGFSGDAAFYGPPARPYARRRNLPHHLKHLRPVIAHPEFAEGIPVTL